MMPKTSDAAVMATARQNAQGNFFRRDRTTMTDV
jgi:hypothetical protein